MSEKENNILSAADIHLEGVNIYLDSIDIAIAFSEEMEKLSIEKIEFTISQEHSFSYEENQVVSNVKVQANFVDKTGEKIANIAKLGILFQYKIDTLEKYSTINTKANTRHPDSRHYDLSLGATLTGISYSTIRGILLHRTKGLIISPMGLLLPIIDPVQLLKKGEIVL